MDLKGLIRFFLKSEDFFDGVAIIGGVSRQVLFTRSGGKVGVPGKQAESIKRGETC